LLFVFEQQLATAAHRLRPPHRDHPAHAERAPRAAAGAEDQRARDHGPLAPPPPQPHQTGRPVRGLREQPAGAVRRERDERGGGEPPRRPQRLPQAQRDDWAAAEGRGPSGHDDSFSCLFFIWHVF